VRAAGGSDAVFRDERLGGWRYPVYRKPGGCDREYSFVQLPAWERIGVIPWANFTRAENFGVGAIFYPVLGLAALLLTLGAAIAFWRDLATSRSLGFPIYAAAVLAVVWAFVTRGVLVPAMFSLRAAGNNTIELQQIFLTVTRWSGVNDVLHFLTFALSLWALAEVFSTSNAMHSE
jgi:hypothetical protein